MRREHTPDRWVFAAALLLAVTLTTSTHVEADPISGVSLPPSPGFDRPTHALFVDDFTDRTLKAWRADRDSVWSVRDGMLRAALRDERQLHSFLYAGDSRWIDYALDFDVCGMQGVDKGCAVRVEPGKKGLGVDLRGPGYDDLKLYVNQFPVGSAKFENPSGTWHHLRIEIRGRDRCKVIIDGNIVLDHRLRPPAPSRGGIALSAYTGGVGHCVVYYDNVAVTPLDTTTSASH